MRGSARRRMRLLVGGVILAAIGASSAAASAALLFQEKPNAFPGADGMYVNYLRLTDIDGDGDLDVIFPAAGSGTNKFGVFVNDGAGNFTDNSATAVGAFSGDVRQIAIGDVDGDGDLDIYAPSANGGADKFFINDGKGVFGDEYASRMPAGLGSHSAATRFGDVDNDGDLDLFIGDRFQGGTNAVAHLYLNDGTGHFTESPGVPMPGGGDDPFDFDVFDADRDFDLDLLIDMHQGGSMLWLNDGTGKFTEASFPDQGALKYGPVPCDVDGDGDLDLWFDNAGPGYTEQLLINDGTGKFSDETSARVTGNPGADDNGVACVDYDNDGDFDAAIASLGDYERVLKNDGSGHFALDPGTFSNVSDSTLWFDFGDVNGDGKLDCVTGQGESGTFEQKLYLGTAAAPVDTQPPKILKVEAPPMTVGAGGTPIIRFAVSDNATTDEGPRLTKAVLKVTVNGGAPTEVKATFMGGDLYRAVLPPQMEMGAMVSFTACATDRAGNEGCSMPMSYTIEGTTNASGATGPGSGGGSASGGASGPGSASGPSGADGAGGGDSLVPADTSGCNCSVPGGDAGKAAGMAALALVGLLGARRRSKR